MSVGGAPALAQSASNARPLPPGYWTITQSSEILAKSETIRLDPDRSALTPSEREALVDLFEVGTLMHSLYERARHSQALSSYARLKELHEALGHPQNTQALIDLYRLFRGPIAVTLDNRRAPFLPVDAQSPARNVYPTDLTQEEVDQFVAREPGQRARILDSRSVVRRATRMNLEADIATLQHFSLVRELHPGELERLQQLPAQPTGIYAVDYAIAYAPELTQAFLALTRAANKVSRDDPEFARYLRNRARDLVSNDYEAGDASWVTGKFERLNAQIGAYETYDDSLLGVKAFHGMSILIRDEVATAELRQALGKLQEFEDALPYQTHKHVKTEIPIGVYNIIADFGEARGTNTATILPNDSSIAERYGRTILLRENIIKNPTLFARDQRVWQAATNPKHAGDLTVEGHLLRTLWHEIGHYLGPTADPQGRPLNEVLGEHGGALEEMKADLVSEFVLRRLNHPALRSIEANGIRRTLLSAKPRTDEPYATMELVQFNWFMKQGLLGWDSQTAQLTINYLLYERTINSLLTEVLRLQASGDKAAVAGFFARWTMWYEDVHERLAARLRDAEGSRFRTVKYGALGD